jgi:transposase
MLLPYDLEDRLPEHHLSRFVVDVVDKLDVRGYTTNIQVLGQQPTIKRMLLSLLFYGYSNGVFSSRKIVSSIYDSVAFRFVASNHHPVHDTISEFCRRFLGQIKGWSKEILIIGEEHGLLNLAIPTLMRLSSGLMLRAIML